MKRHVRIVRTFEDWLAIGNPAYGSPVVCDVETFTFDPKNGKLLGVAIAPVEGRFPDGSEAAYVVVQEYLYGRSEWRYVLDKGVEVGMRTFFAFSPLVGFNYTYDRAWVDHFFGVRSNWQADCRLMWHMSDASFVKKAYRLKDAQVEVLGWEQKGDVELREQVEARGGSLDDGDHYLADTDVLGYYACLDAISTRDLYLRKKPFFDRHQQWWLLEKMMTRDALLRWNTDVGVAVDEERLAREVDTLKQRFEEAERRCRSVAEEWVEDLEVRWRDEKADVYKTDDGREKFLSDPTRWERWSPSSSKDRVTLFHEQMKLPVVEYVKPRKDKKTGRKVRSTTPASTPEALSLAVKTAGRIGELSPVVEAFFELSHSKYLYQNFAKPMLGSVRAGRVHPNYNSCGTLSYRLSGSKPYFLNLPFSEPLMDTFHCDPGMVGLHDDLISVEPCITAHYSQDPALLKVFRDGLGDVYLDLALTLFPSDRELHQFYNPNAPVTSDVKKRFKRQRDVAKIVQLAIAYTGTEWTVSQSLTKAGFPTTLDEAEVLVRNYWLHFQAVRLMNQRLFALNKRQGFLRNVIGRVIMSPSVDWKDLPNKFIQSSGHDFLSLRVLRTYELFAERGIKAVPSILDLHDATTLQVPEAQVEAAEAAMDQALADVNAWTGLSVPVRSERKRFRTLFGLKNEEAVTLEEEAA